MIMLATGITTEIREFVKMAFEEAGVELEFKGKGVDEKAIIKSSDGRYPVKPGKEILSIDPKYFRPTEVELLMGDPTKAKNKLGWEPKYDLKALVKDMVESDIKLMKKDQFLRNGGYETLNYFE